MLKDEQGEEQVFRTGEAHRLLEAEGEGLTDDERALLLALVSVDAEAAGGLDEETRAALDKLKTQIEGYDVEELAQAVKHLVMAKPRKGRKLEWPELQRKRRKRSETR
ncbi:MAG TPA: hypothetical protein G4N97_04455 [Thermoflexia bacterium]|nr:MAG: hypothetical protein DRI80_08880 [Chloroflexota bacterium]HEY67505.1 hypothetical protein [Thermoflexia bacterium]